MRFSRNWIAQYVDLPDSDEELSETLSALGLVVDAADPRGDDLSLDLDVPSNRPDVMNHFGVARELALATGAELRPPALAAFGDGAPTSEDLTVEIEDPEACPRFVALAVRGVNVVPSPAWLVERLESIGLRPINAVVDISNFVMWELGRPMHAYDRAELAGDRLVARRARPDEKVLTLDEVERELDGRDLAIADGTRPVGLGGLMGGEESGVTDSTRDVILECAAFDPATIRSMARRHAMHTDASHRFERGLTTAGPERAVRRAAALIVEICGGTIASEPIDLCPAPSPRPVIGLSARRLRGLLGVEIPTENATRILEGIGCEVEPVDDGLRVTAPEDRLDITRPVDLIEEIARFHGYERLPDTLPLLRRSLRRGAEPSLRREAELRRLCIALGYWQTVTMALTSDTDQAPFLGERRLVELANPLNEGLSRLRATLLPGLLRVVARNLNVGAPCIRLFEAARVFSEPERRGNPVEGRALAIVGAGLASPTHHLTADRLYGFADLKSAIETLAARMRWPEPTWRSDRAPGFQDGATARIRIGSAAGVAGKIDRSATEHFGLEREVWALELEIEPLLALPSSRIVAAQPARYPASDRDVTLLVPEAVAYGDLASTVHAVQEAPLESVDLIDTYRGEDIPDGQEALTLRLTFRSRERTLTAEEVESAMDAILARLADEVGAERR